jgi:hypothetical protein
MDQQPYELYDDLDRGVRVRVYRGDGETMEKISGVFIKFVKTHGVYYMQIKDNGWIRLIPTYEIVRLGVRV